jgi:hypothetical protein
MQVTEPESPPTSGPQPLMVSADCAAKLCSISPATWFRLRAMGKIGPPAVRLGGRVLYRVGGPDGLLAWVAAGCPDAERWKALMEGKSRSGGR